MSEYRISPIFGKLTDPEEIAIYEAEMRAYEEAYSQAEYEYYWMLFMQENEMITD